MMEMAFVLVVGLFAGTISGIVGTGSSIILLPVLVFAYGPQQAVPIMAVAAILANISRVMVWWRAIDWRAVAVYGLGGAPAAALGAGTLLVLPARVVDTVLGLFFLAMVPVRRWLAVRDLRLRLGHLAIAGMAIGYLTGIIASTGPISVPVFVAYGLSGGAFLGTEAASSLVIYTSKAIAFQHFGALPLEAALKGLTIGASLMAGSVIAKRIVLALKVERFHLLMDAVMVLSGLTLLWTAIRG